MTINPTYHTVSILRMIKAAQSISKPSFPVHYNGASTIIPTNNINPIPTQLTGYSMSQLHKIDRYLEATNARGTPSQSNQIGSLINIAV